MCNVIPPPPSLVGIVCEVSIIFATMPHSTHHYDQKGSVDATLIGGAVRPILSALAPFFASKSILTSFLRFLDCLPRVTSSASSANLISNPSSTKVTFWSGASNATVDFTSTVQQSAPMQLQILMDMNGQSRDEADKLADVLLQGSLAQVFGGALGAGSNISVRFYTEAPTSGPLIAIGGGSVFNSNWNNVADAMGVSYLLSNKDRPSTTPTSTRLLELAAEILNSWPASQSTSNALQILVIVTPNKIVTTGEQWTLFEEAVRASLVLPVFFSPSSGSTPWQTDIASAWANAFPAYPTAPIAVGSLSADSIWDNFNIQLALNTALGFVTGVKTDEAPSASGSTPATSAASSLSPLIISSSSATDLSLVSDIVNDGSRTVTFTLSLNASVNPLSAPSSYSAGILGTRPVTFTSSMEAAPTGTDAVIPIQTASVFTHLNIPTSNETLSVKILSLPTQGVLASNGVNITAVPFEGSTSSFSYAPNVVRGEEDSFTYSLQLACGSWGDFTMALNLTYVPMTPIITSTPTITLTEDDMTSKLVNFSSLVGRTYSDSTIVLLSLATMAGNLTNRDTVSPASLTTKYLLTNAVFDFTNYSPSRGARSFNITYVVDNGQGATATGVVFFSITDVLHVPQVYSKSTTTAISTFLVLADADNDDITATIALTASQAQACWYNLTTSVGTCVNLSSLGPTSVTWTLPASSLLSMNYNAVLGLSTVQFSVTVKDNTQAQTSTFNGTITSPGLIPALLQLVLNLVGGLLSALLGLPAGADPSIRIYFNSGTPNNLTASTCYFPVAPSAAKMYWKSTDLVTDGTTVNWGSTDNFADYKLYRGVSGADTFFFQCAYPYGGGSASAQFFIYAMTIPIPQPSGSALTLNKAPNAASIFIPIQGLVSAGGLSIKNIVTDVGSVWSLVSGGILFTPNSATSTLSYSLCSLVNSTLCSSVITNTINTITSLPVLATSAQTFKANLNNALNTFHLDLPSGVDGIIVQSLGLLRSGTVIVNGVTLSSSAIAQYIPTDGTFTFQYAGSLTVAADLLTMYSFTFVAVSNGYPSQPATVYIVPVSGDLTSLLPTVTNALTDLVSDLNDTLSIVSTLVPGFRVELDIFGKKSSQSLYSQLEQSVAAANDLTSRRAVREYLEQVYAAEGKALDRRFSLASSEAYTESKEFVLASRRATAAPEALSTDGVTFSATMTAPPSGKLELCYANGTCVVVSPGVTFTVSYADTVFLTPPLLTDLVAALGTLTWDIVVLVDNVVTNVIEGTVELANDIVSDTLRNNVLNNVAAALVRAVPGVKNLLEAAGLDPDGCGSVVPPAPFVCYQGQLVANGTVTVNETVSVTVAETKILAGNLNVTTQGTLILQFVELGTIDLSNLPFFNVSGDVNAEGPILVNVTEQQLERLVFAHVVGGTREAYFAHLYEQQAEEAIRKSKRDAEASPDVSPDSVGPGSPSSVPVTSPSSSPVAAPVSTTVESRTKSIIEASNITTLTPPLTLTLTSKCYTMKTRKVTTGTRQTLMTIFVFNPEQDTTCVPPPPSAYSVDPEGNPVPWSSTLDPANPNSPARKQRSYYIMVGVLVGVAVLVIVAVVIIFLIFKYNRTAKHTARPYRVRRTKGQTYRTQPTGNGNSTDSSSYGSTEMLVQNSADSPRVYPPGFSAEMEDPVSSSYDDSDEVENDSDNEEAKYHSDHESIPDETEDDGEMPRSLPSSTI